MFHVLVFHIGNISIIVMRDVPVKQHSLVLSIFTAEAANISYTIIFLDLGIAANTKGPLLRHDNRRGGKVAESESESDSDKMENILQYERLEVINGKIKDGIMCNKWKQTALW